MPALAPTDETFLRTAARRRETTMEIARPASEVWSELTRDGTLVWSRAVTGLQWLTPRPFGVGTRREIRVLGLMRIVERYIVWEEGRRKAFVGEAINLPLLSRIAEDYVVEPVTESSSRFTWTVAWEPSPLGRPGDPLNRAIFASLFADSRRHFGASG